MPENSGYGCVVPDVDDSRKREVLALRDTYLEMSLAAPKVVDRRVRDELLQLINHATTLSSWWRERLVCADLSARTTQELVKSLPITSRALVQDEFEEMKIYIPNTDLADYILQKTTGSTGQPVQVIKYNPLYSRDIDAITLLEWKWHQRDVRKKMGLFRLGSHDADFVKAGPPLEYLGEAAPMFQRSSVDRTRAELLDALFEHQPSYLLTNPLSLKLVAQAQLENPRRIAPIEQILTLADRVDDSLRDLVLHAFGAKIVDRYSSVEFGMIALQCPKHEHLHVIAPNVYVEAVDENDVAVPIGQPGRALITGLHGFAMPMLRYEQGDVITMGSRCDTGISWPVIEIVHGRVRSYVDGPDGDRKLLTLFTADFLLMREIQDFRLVKFDDCAVFIAQTRSVLTNEQRDRIVKSLHDDVFRSAIVVHFLTQREALRAPKWKVREIYIVPQPVPEDLTIYNVDAILERTDQISEGL